MDNLPGYDAWKTASPACDELEEVIDEADLELMAIYEMHKSTVAAPEAYPFLLDLDDGDEENIPF